MSSHPTRRSFLALLAPAALFPAVPSASAAASARPVALVECPVMGLAYYRYDAVGRNLSPGIRLILSHEPRNRHDHSAIAVLTGAGDKLGYVPRGNKRRLRT